jgi:tetratricopeptide (TPR) repeat protein
MVFQVHGYNAEAILCYEEAERLAPSAMRWPYFLGMCVTLHDRDRAIAAYQRAAEKIDTGQASQLERRAVLLRVAETELEQGQDQAAEETLLLVCRDEANDPWANLLLARVKERRGDLTGARKHAQTAESEPTSRKAAGQILARVSQREGKTDEARARLASLLSLPDSSRPDPLANEVQQEGRGIHAAIEHANRQLLAGQYDNVIRLLTQAVVLYPDAPYAWVTLGKAELKVNRVAKAEDSFRKAIACDSRFVEAHFQLGLALGRQNRLEEATEAFRRAIELKPDLVPAQYMLGETLALRGRTNEAISALEICISGKPDLLAAYLRLAPLLEGNGQKPEAIRYLREAVRIHPESDAAKSMLARIESAP